MDDEALMGEQIQISDYEQEYNDVIQEISKICRHVVWNNNPTN